MNVGDPYRLEHIKLMLKQKRTVYGSDRVYLDHLIYEYIEQIKTQKQLAKIRGKDPFEEDSEDIPSEENIEDKSNDDIMELDHIYCWKCGKSIPVNSKFCLDCGSDIKNPEIKDNSIVENTSENIIEQIKTQKQLAKIRGEDPFEENSEDGTSEENVEDKSKDDIIELDHIYCWKCGTSIPVNSKFCLDCGSDIKKPEIKDNARVEDISENMIEEITKRKSKDGSKKNILMVVGVLAILAIIGGAVVMGGTFDKTISSIGDNKPLSKEITISESDSISKCGAGTIFDDTTNSCVLAGTQTNSQCGAGTIFDDTTNSCVLAGT